MGKRIGTSIFILYIFLLITCRFQARVNADESSVPQVENLVNIGESFVGSIASPADKDTFGIELLDGTLLDVKLRAENRLVIDGLYVMPNGHSNPLTVSHKSSRGSSARIRKLPVRGTGMFVLTLSGKNQTTGSYSIRFNARLPLPRLREEGFAPPSGSGQPQTYNFSAVAGTLVNITIKSKGDGALIPHLEIVGPDGKNINIVPPPRVQKGKLTIRKFKLPSLGEYSLKVSGANNTSGNFRLTLKGRKPKPSKTVRYEEKSGANVSQVVSPDSTQDVPIDTQIQVIFSKPINPLSLNRQTFVLKRVNRSTGVTIETVSGNLSLSTDNMVVTFTPSLNLLGSAFYTLEIMDGLQDVDGNPVSRLVFSFTTENTGGQGDQNGPKVVAISPTPYAAGINVKANIVITFSEPLDRYTVNSNSIKLIAGTPSSASSLAAISGSISLNGVGNIVTLDPDNDLEPGKTYTVQVTDALHGISTNPAQPFSSSFTTTASGNFLTVEDVQPADGSDNVPVDTDIIVTFSAPINPATMTFGINGSFRLTDPTGAVVPVNVPVMSQGGKVATLSPINPLRGGPTKYTLNLSSQIRGVDGQSLSPFVSNFTTEDKTPPSVLTLFPANNATEVPFNVVIDVTFSEKIVRNSVTIGENGTFALRANGNDVPGVLTFTNNDTGIRFTPNNNLADSTTYTIVIGSVSGGGSITDLAGNQLALYQSSFTTVDLVGPKVIAVSPDGSRRVSRRTSVVVTFSEPVRKTTVVVGNTFTLTHNGVKVSGGPVIFNATGDEFTFDPTLDLEPLTTYTITVTTGVQDLKGNFLDQNNITPGNQSFTSTFTTLGDVSGPPEVIDVMPKNNEADVVRNSRVVIEFSEGIKESSLVTVPQNPVPGGPSPTIVVSNAATAQTIPGTLSFIHDVDDPNLVIAAAFTAAPDGVLAANTKHSVRVVGGPSGVLDGTGTPMVTDFDSTFTTGTDFGPEVDVNGVVPSDKAIGVGLLPDIVIPFITTVDIDGTTINSKSISLFDPQGLAVSLTPSGAVPNAKTFTFKPTAALESQTKYTIQVTTAVKNVLGRSLVAPFRSTFTTTDSEGPAIERVVAKAVAGHANDVISITFTEALSPDTATDIANYTFQTRDRDGNLVTLNLADDLDFTPESTVTYDRESRTVTITLDNSVVREQPSKVAIASVNGTGQGGDVWVTHSVTANVTQLNNQGDTVRVYSVARGPTGVAIDDGKNIWIANTDSNRVTKLRGIDGVMLQTLNLTPSGARGPIALEVDSGNPNTDLDDVVWVANHDSNNVTRITSAIIEPLPYIRDGGDGIVETKAIGDDIQLVGVGAAVQPNSKIILAGPNNILDTVASSTLVTGDDVEVRGNGRADILPVNIVGDDILAVPFGEAVPAGTAIVKPGPNNLLETVPSGDDVIGNTIAGSFSTGGDGPTDIAIDPNGDVWVCHGNSNDVTKLSGGSGGVNIGDIEKGPFSAGTEPVAILVDSVNGATASDFLIWVLNRASNNLSKFDKDGNEDNDSPFPTDSTLPGSLPEDMVIDNSGILWILTNSADHIVEPMSGGDGIANTQPFGDDILEVPVGSPVSPGQVIINPGDNKVLDTTALGDDIKQSFSTIVRLDGKTKQVASRDFIARGFVGSSLTGGGVVAGADSLTIDINKTFPTSGASFSTGPGVAYVFDPQNPDNSDVFSYGSFDPSTGVFSDIPSSDNFSIGHYKITDAHNDGELVVQLLNGELGPLGLAIDKRQVADPSDDIIYFTNTKSSTIGKFQVNELIDVTKAFSVSGEVIPLRDDRRDNLRRVNGSAILRQEGGVSSGDTSLTVANVVGTFNPGPGLASIEGDVFSYELFSTSAFSGIPDHDNLPTESGKLLDSETQFSISSSHSDSTTDTPTVVEGLVPFTLSVSNVTDIVGNPVDPTGKTFSGVIGLDDSELVNPDVSDEVTEPLFVGDTEPPVLEAVAKPVADISAPILDPNGVIEGDATLIIDPSAIVAPQGRFFNPGPGIAFIESSAGIDAFSYASFDQNTGVFSGIPAEDDFDKGLFRISFAHLDGEIVTQTTDIVIVQFNESVIREAAEVPENYSANPTGSGAPESSIDAELDLVRSSSVNVEFASIAPSATVSVKGIEDLAGNLRPGTFVAPVTISSPPIVESYSPTIGSAEGGTEITIRGSSFQSGARLFIIDPNNPANVIEGTVVEVVNRDEDENADTDQIVAIAPRSPVPSLFDFVPNWMIINPGVGDETIRRSFGPDPRALLDNPDGVLSGAIAKANPLQQVNPGADKLQVTNLVGTFRPGPDYAYIGTDLFSYTDFVPSLDGGIFNGIAALDNSSLDPPEFRITGTHGSGELVQQAENITINNITTPSGVGSFPTSGPGTSEPEVFAIGAIDGDLFSYAFFDGTTFFGISPVDVSSLNMFAITSSHKPIVAVIEPPTGGNGKADTTALASSDDIQRIPPGNSASPGAIIVEGGTDGQLQTIPNDNGQGGTVPGGDDIQIVHVPVVTRQDVFAFSGDTEEETSTPPSVLSFVPSAGAFNVPINSKIVVNTSEEVRNVQTRRGLAIIEPITNGNSLADTVANPASDDTQVIPVGEFASPGATVVSPGANGVLETVPQGDDFISDINNLNNFIVLDLDNPGSIVPGSVQIVGNAIVFTPDFATAKVDDPNGVIAGQTAVTVDNIISVGNFTFRPDGGQAFIENDIFSYTNFDFDPNTGVGIFSGIPSVGEMSLQEHDSDAPVFQGVLLPSHRYKIELRGQLEGAQSDIVDLSEPSGNPLATARMPLADPNGVEPTQVTATLISDVNPNIGRFAVINVSTTNSSRMPTFRSGGRAAIDSSGGISPGTTTFQIDNIRGAFDPGPSLAMIINPTDRRRDFFGYNSFDLATGTFSGIPISGQFAISEFHFDNEPVAQLEYAFLGDDIFSYEIFDGVEFSGISPIDIQSSVIPAYAVSGAHLLGEVVRQAEDIRVGRFGQGFEPNPRGPRLFLPFNAVAYIAGDNFSYAFFDKFTNRFRGISPVDGAIGSGRFSVSVPHHPTEIREPMTGGNGIADSTVTIGSDDNQRVTQGGAVNAGDTIIDAGADGILNSTPQGDDVFNVLVTQSLSMGFTTGSKGDSAPPKVISISPAQTSISEPLVGGNGTADTVVAPASDDIQLVAQGTAVSPGQTIIDPGPNGRIDTTPGGDDIVVSSAVPSGTVIAVTFDEPIDPQTVSDLTIQLKIVGGVSAVPVRFNLTSNDARLMIAPNSALSPATTYQLTIVGGNEGVKDLAGNGLDQDLTTPEVDNFASTFTVEPSAPFVVSVFPFTRGEAINRELNTQVVAIFSEEIDPSTLNFLTSFIVVPQLGELPDVPQPVPGFFEVEVDDGEINTRNGIDDDNDGLIDEQGQSIVTFTPFENLVFGLQYSVTITPAITDATGIALDQNRIADDGNQPFQSSFIAHRGSRQDTLPPVVMDITPNDASTGVNVSSTIQVTFSDPRGAAGPGNFRINPETVVSYGEEVAFDSSVFPPPAREMRTPPLPSDTPNWLLFNPFNFPPENPADPDNSRSNDPTLFVTYKRQITCRLNEPNGIQPGSGTLTIDTIRNLYPGKLMIRSILPGGGGVPNSFSLPDPTGFNIDGVIPPGPNRAFILVAAADLPDTPDVTTTSPTIPPPPTGNTPQAVVIPRIGTFSPIGSPEFPTYLEGEIFIFADSTPEDDGNPVFFQAGDSFTYSTFSGGVFRGVNGVTENHSDSSDSLVIVTQWDYFTYTSFDPVTGTFSGIPSSGPNAINATIPDNSLVVIEYVAALGTHLSLDQTRAVATLTPKETLTAGLDLAALGDNGDENTTYTVHAIGTFPDGSPGITDLAGNPLIDFYVDQNENRIMDTDEPLLPITFDTDVFDDLVSPGVLLNVGWTQAIQGVPEVEGVTINDIDFEITGGGVSDFFAPAGVLQLFTSGFSINMDFSDFVQAGATITNPDPSSLRVAANVPLGGGFLAGGLDAEDGDGIIEPNEDLSPFFQVSVSGSNMTADMTLPPGLSFTEHQGATAQLAAPVSVGAQTIIVKNISGDFHPGPGIAFIEDDQFSYLHFDRASGTFSGIPDIFGQDSSTGKFAIFSSHPVNASVRQSGVVLTATIADFARNRSRNFNLFFNTVEPNDRNRPLERRDNWLLLFNRDNYRIESFPEDEFTGDVNLDGDLIDDIVVTSRVARVQAQINEPAAGGVLAGSDTFKVNNIIGLFNPGPAVAFIVEPDGTGVDDFSYAAFDRTSGTFTGIPPLSADDSASGIFAISHDHADGALVIQGNGITDFDEDLALLGLRSNKTNLDVDPATGLDTNQLVRREIITRIRDKINRLFNIGPGDPSVAVRTPNSVNIAVFLPNDPNAPDPFGSDPTTSTIPVSLLGFGGDDWENPTGTIQTGEHDPNGPASAAFSRAFPIVDIRNSLQNDFNVNDGVITDIDPQSNPTGFDDNLGIFGTNFARFFINAPDTATEGLDERSTFDPFIPFRRPHPEIREPFIGGNGTADTAASGDDIQVIPVGNSVQPGDVIVSPGSNGKLDSQVSGDDIPITGSGVPIGENAIDIAILNGTFNPASATPSQLARFSNIWQAIDGISDVMAALGAHTIGHGLGLVADGDQPEGLFGEREFGFDVPFRVRSGHWEVRTNNLMSSIQTYLSMIDQDPTSPFHLHFDIFTMSYLQEKLTYRQAENRK